MHARFPTTLCASVLAFTLLIGSLWTGSATALAADGGDMPPALPAPAAPAKPRVYHLVLKGSFTEHKNPEGISPLVLLSGGARVKQKSFLDLIGFFDRAAKDATLQGVFIDMQDPDIDMPPAQVDVLLARLDKCRAAGKKLFAYIEGGTKLQFLIACHCDVVVMPELSTFEIGAPSLQVQFFSDTLNTLGVKVQAIRAGAYKSAVEPFTRNSMSPEMRENYTTLLTDIDSQLLKRVLGGTRKLTEEAFKELRKDQVLTARQSLAAGLCDVIGGTEDMPAVMQKALGQPVELVEKTKAPPPQINFMSLLTIDRTEPSVRWKADGVGVLFLSGEIVDGGGGGMSGGALIAEFPAINAIQELAGDDRCKAVVLRIDSPGGSASASERIYQALKALAAKKPLVVSMADVAASGGYYIAAPAQKIYAQSTTVTGSIGVFGLVPDFGGLFDKVGVKTETITLDGTLPLSGNQALTDRQKKMMERDIDEAYQVFLTRVADGRKKTTDEIHKLAQGRVYTGGQAKEVGLVDEIGTLEDAIAAAAAAANLPAGYDRQYFPKYPEFRGLMDLLDALNPDAQALPVSPFSMARISPLLADLQDTAAMRRLTTFLRMLRHQSREGHRMAVFAWNPLLPEIR